MTTLRAVSGGAAGRTVDGFEVAWLTEEGDQHRSTLTDVWATRFEWCQPARRFPSYKGQRHFNGRWWSSTMDQHVGYESWLERDHLMLLDHDPAVVAVASQPFWLFWPVGEDKVRSHVPDYFARLADGGALVVDCRPVERIKPKDMAAFEATRAACELVGWQYRLAGAPDAILVANVRWLAGYRHPRHDLPAVAGPLRHAPPRSQSEHKIIRFRKVDPNRPTPRPSGPTFRTAGRSLDHPKPSRGQDRALVLYGRRLHCPDLVCI